MENERTVSRILNRSDKNEFSNTNNNADNGVQNNFNFTFKRSNTPVNHPAIADINKHNLSQHDYKSNATANVNIEMNKRKYDSNKASGKNIYCNT